MEKINPDNPDQYVVDGRWEDMEILYEDIPVKGQDEPYRLRVRLHPQWADHQ